MYTQLTQAEKLEREKDVFFICAVATIGFVIIELAIVGLFVQSSHSIMAWSGLITLGGAVWCLIILFGGCARQSWRDMNRFGM